MNQKKLMISLTAMSLILVAAVVLVVHNSRSDSPKTVPIQSDSPAIACWITKGVRDKDSMDYVYMDLKKNGSADVKIGKYDFEGSWQPTEDGKILIRNDKDEDAYEGKIKEKGKTKTMNIASVHVTDSKRWILTETDPQ